MNMRALIKLLVVAVLVLVSSSFKAIPPPATYTISIEITNIRNKKGEIQLELYRTQKAFKAENPYKTFRISKNDVTGKTLNFKITGLEPNHYGLALLDDENGNKKMDYGLVYPKEGFGFSDYYHTAWSKPTFYKFKLYLDTDKSVMMKIRYM
jgi:uncharacterized protein (DUF2141 family)